MISGRVNAILALRTSAMTAKKRNAASRRQVVPFFKPSKANLNDFSKWSWNASVPPAAAINAMVSVTFACNSKRASSSSSGISNKISIVLSTNGRNSSFEENAAVPMAAIVTFSFQKVGHTYDGTLNFRVDRSHQNFDQCCHERREVWPQYILRDAF